jgi:hypothetical protein
VNTFWIVLLVWVALAAAFLALWVLFYKGMDP